MNNEKYYWAITGRMIRWPLPNDHGDCAYTTPEPCTRDNAELGFRQFMIETALEDESEDDLRERLGVDADANLVDYVYIVSMFRSETMIYLV